jgi:hypothetical protein
MASGIAAAATAVAASIPVEITVTITETKTQRDAINAKSLYSPVYTTGVVTADLQAAASQSISIVPSL